MSLRGLLVLTGLLAAAVFVLLRLGHGTAPGNAAAPQAPLVTAFAEEGVREIDLACGGTAVTLGRETSRSWQIKRPFEAEADPRRVHEVIAALQDARVLKVIAGAAADPAAFGLSPAACTVRLGFETGTSALTLRLGRNSPVGSERYASADDARVVFTDGSLYGVVARSAEAFREKRLIPVDPEAITRIAVDRPDGRLVVQRVAGAWQVEAPRDDAASSGACAGLARAVASMELTSSGAVGAPRNAHPARCLRLEVTERGGNTPFVAFVAAAGIDGKRLGWREGRGLAGLVEESAARELQLPWDSFRDARIMSFSSPDVRRLTVVRGGTTLRIAREGETSPWTGSEGSAPFAVEASRVEDLLDKLQGLTGAGFEPDAPGTQATGTIALEGERGALARLTWGPLGPSSGSDVSSLWVTTPARPGVVFRVEASGFGPVPAKAADLAPAATARTEGVGGS